MKPDAGDSLELIRLRYWADRGIAVKAIRKAIKGMDVGASLESVIQLAAHNLAINARTRRGKLRGTDTVKRNKQELHAEIAEYLRDAGGDVKVVQIDRQTLGKKGSERTIRRVKAKSKT